jgi:hypothetical protein
MAEGGAAVSAAEHEAVGIIAKAAKDVLRKAEPVFTHGAEKLGLRGSAKQILSDAEERAVAKLPAESRSAAQEVFQHAATAEARITPELKNIVGSIKGGELAGLEYSTKSEASLLRKVAGDVERGASVHEATSGINDAVRYTIKSSRDDYARVTQEAIEKMKTAGFTPVSAKNFWGREGYQGINSVWRDAEGHTFEMQFHTAESLEAKEATHELYEMARVLPDGNATRQEIMDLQNQVFGRVTPVPGAPNIGVR